MTKEYINLVMADALDFWEEIKNMGYIIERSDIINSKPNRRFNQILQLVHNANINTITEKDFEYRTPEENFKEVRNLYDEMFNGKYNHEILRLESLTRESNQFGELDGGIALEIDASTRTKKVTKIRVNNLRSMHSSILVSHEDAHGAYYLKPIDLYTNYNYNEVLPIIMEMIMAYRLGTDILLKAQAIRIQNFKENAIEHCNIMPYFTELDIPNEKLSKAALALKFSFYLTYGYMISTIYAEQLFNYYLENPKEISKRIENIIERKETIPTVLQDLNINLGDNTTFNTFQKTLSKVSK